MNRRIVFLTSLNIQGTLVNEVFASAQNLCVEARLQELRECKDDVEHLRSHPEVSVVVVYILILPKGRQNGFSAGDSRNYWAKPVLQELSSCARVRVLCIWEENASDQWSSMTNEQLAARLDWGDEASIVACGPRREDIHLTLRSALGVSPGSRSLDSIMKSERKRARNADGKLARSLARHVLAGCCGWVAYGRSQLLLTAESSTATDDHDSAPAKIPMDHSQDMDEMQDESALEEVPVSGRYRTAVVQADEGDVAQRQDGKMHDVQRLAVNQTGRTHENGERGGSCRSTSQGEEKEGDTEGRDVSLGTAGLFSSHSLGYGLGDAFLYLFSHPRWSFRGIAKRIIHAAVGGFLVGWVLHATKGSDSVVGLVAPTLAVSALKILLWSARCVVAGPVQKELAMLTKRWVVEALVMLTITGNEQYRWPIALPFHVVLGLWHCNAWKPSEAVSVALNVAISVEMPLVAGRIVSRGVQFFTTGLLLPVTGSAWKAEVLAAIVAGLCMRITMYSVHKVGRAFVDRVLPREWQIQKLCRKCNIRTNGSTVEDRAIHDAYLQATSHSREPLEWISLIDHFRIIVMRRANASSQDSSATGEGSAWTDWFLVLLRVDQLYARAAHNSGRWLSPSCEELLMKDGMLTDEEAALVAQHSSAITQRSQLDYDTFLRSVGKVKKCQ